MIKILTFKIFADEWFTEDQFKKIGWSIKTPDTDIDNFDALFQINVYKRNKQLPEYLKIKEYNKPVLVGESPLFRKNLDILPKEKIRWRLGWDHFLRQGKFNNIDCPPDRWLQIQKDQNIEIKPWKSNGRYILLILQKPTDSSLNSLYERYNFYNEWVEDTINNIRQYTDRPILIRPHIKAKNLNINHLLNDSVTLSTVWKNRTIFEGGSSLLEDFKNAHAVVGYNSNALIESVCEGIPTFALSDESIAYDMSNNIKDLENPKFFDRTQWLYNCAYCVWTKEEIINRTAINHLKGVYF